MTRDIVSVKAVVDGVYRLRGFDPSSYAPSAREREDFAELLLDALRTAWEDQPWPLLVTTGFRRYRPPWAEGVLWRRGQDCWARGRYWHALRDSMGVRPGDNPTVWEEVPPGRLGYKFVEFDQPWADDDGLALDAIDPSGVELGAFAYADDPMCRPDAPPLVPCRMAAGCVFLPDDAPDGAWVRYRPECPCLTLEAFDAARGYRAGDCCCDAAGECWRCRALSLSGAAPSASDPRWERVGVPRFLLQYVRRRLQADLASEDEGKWKTLALADRELERLRDKWISTGSGSAKLRFSAPRREARP